MSATKILMIVGFGLLLIVLMPYAAIWSLNTLFALTIPFTFDTWCAAVVLSGIVSGNHFVTYKK
jgi:hypothetical protein